MSGFLTAENAGLTDDVLRELLRKGKGYAAASVSNGLKQTSANNNLIVCGLSLFNPANSGKTLLVFRLEAMAPVGTGDNQGIASTGNEIRLITADPSGGAGYTDVITAVKLLTTSAASVASVCSSANNISASIAPAGRLYADFFLSPNNLLALLSGSEIIPLPPGSGLQVNLLVTNSGNSFNVNARWLELVSL